MSAAPAGYEGRGAARTRPTVLYYAHQHGSGHVRHAATLIRADVADVTVATAHPRAADLLPEGTPVVTLPSDLVPGHVQPRRSPLHHTPVGPMIQERFAALHCAALQLRPDVCVVDVSVEAALFLRLAGFPVIHRRMHGKRTDAAHALVYAESDVLIAHYGAALEDPAWQAAHGERTVHLGVPDLDGRLDRRAEITTSAEAAGVAGPTTDGAAGDAAVAASGAIVAEPRIAVITGTGGGGVAVSDLARAAAAVPHARWDVYGPVRDQASDDDSVESADGADAPGGLHGPGSPGGPGDPGGPDSPGGRGGRPASGTHAFSQDAALPENLTLHGWTDDAPARAARADVVVVSAGFNASVDAARTGRPMVLAPEPRPFDEQECFARAAEQAAGAPWCAWEDPEADWAGAVERALGDPSSADRLAAALLVAPEEHARRWSEALTRAAEAARD